MVGNKTCSLGLFAKKYMPLRTIAEEADVKSLHQYQEWYRQSINDPEAFWSRLAAEYFWHKRWDTPFCRWNFDPRNGAVLSEWFIGAQTNLCYNCLDRHVAAGRGDKFAFLWEGNDVGVSNRVTYNDVLRQVCQLANYLKSQGVGRGTEVTIHMPQTPQLVVAMLACCRIGAVHSVVFGGFSAESLSQRIIDSKSTYLITCSCVKRGSKLVDMKSVVDEALGLCQQAGLAISRCLVWDHSTYAPRHSFSMIDGRDEWWQDAVADHSEECPVEWVDAEHPLFKLYTSGSTAKPKGLVHTTGGYMVGVGTTFKIVFDHKPSDVYFCTADCGWITGHSYVVYGPMLNCATQVLFEGTPMHPDPGRYWEIVQKHRVSVFYTAPTAIRLLLGLGDEHVTNHDLSSIRLLGTVGEPINHEAWLWYYEVIGGSQCPIMDTWWQTETGSHMITPLPGATQLKPGSATLPFFGVLPALLDEEGHEVLGVGEGYLAIHQSWPSIARGIAEDPETFERTYFTQFPGYYNTGDRARRDEDGFYWILGRVDDVINVSGHRLGTAEVENALAQHPSTAEAAVVPCEHPIKGEGIYAFVVLKQGVSTADEVRKELSDTVRRMIGAIALPDVIHLVQELPKTRSGKIMRRMLRKVANGEEDSIGDMSSLHNPASIGHMVATRQFFTGRNGMDGSHAVHSLYHC